MAGGTCGCTSWGTAPSCFMTSMVMTTRNTTRWCGRPQATAEIHARLGLPSLCHAAGHSQWVMSLVHEVARRENLIKYSPVRMPVCRTSLPPVPHCHSGRTQ